MFSEEFICQNDKLRSAPSAAILPNRLAGWMDGRTATSGRTKIARDPARILHHIPERQNACLTVFTLHPTSVIAQISCEQDKLLQAFRIQTISNDLKLQKENID